MKSALRYALLPVTAALAVVCVCLTVQNRALRRELVEKSRPRIACVREPESEVAGGPGRAASRRRGKVSDVFRSGRRLETAPQDKCSKADAASMDERIKAMRLEQAEKRRRRLEELRNMSDDEKGARREEFIARMRGRAERRLKEFVRKTGLDAAQTEAFASTVAALDATLQERAREWADTIAETGSFTQDARLKFLGDMTEVLNAGYAEMDAKLPATWRTDDGNLNLMQIVGDAAFAPVVEALTEAGIEDGLQTIGMLMGGPGGEGGGPEVPVEGAPANGEAPGQMGGPGMGAPGMGGPGMM